MKKILIPTLLTVASTPLISLVGCGKNTFELKHAFTITDEHEFHCLRTEERIDLVKDKTYTALIDASKFPNNNKAAIDLSFYVSDNVTTMDDIDTARIATASVMVDGNSLSYTDDVIPKTGQFTIHNDYHRSEIAIGKPTISQNSEIEITFTLLESVQQNYLISLLWQDFNLFRV